MYASLGRATLSAKCIAGPKYPWVVFVSLGVALDSAETPFAKTPFSSSLKSIHICCAPPPPLQNAKNSFVCICYEKLIPKTFSSVSVSAMKRKNNAKIYFLLSVMPPGRPVEDIFSGFKIAPVLRVIAV